MPISHKIRLAAGESPAANRAHEIPFIQKTVSTHALLHATLILLYSLKKILKFRLKNLKSAL
jgi:hypothetical protein